MPVECVHYPMCLLHLVSCATEKMPSVNNFMHELHPVPRKNSLECRWETWDPSFRTHLLLPRGPSRDPTNSRKRGHLLTSKSLHVGRLCRKLLFIKICSTNHGTQSRSLALSTLTWLLQLQPGTQRLGSCRLDTLRRLTLISHPSHAIYGIVLLWVFFLLVACSFELR